MSSISNELYSSGGLAKGNEIYLYEEFIRDFTIAIDEGEAILLTAGFSDDNSSDEIRFILEAAPVYVSRGGVECLEAEAPKCISFDPYSGLMQKDPSSHPWTEEPCSELESFQRTLISRLADYANFGRMIHGILKDLQESVDAETVELIQIWREEYRDLFDPIDDSLPLAVVISWLAEIDGVARMGSTAVQLELFAQLGD